MIACDDNYGDSELQRCVIIFVYAELNYIENADGDFMRAGVNDRNNGNTLKL